MKTIYREEVNNYLITVCEIYRNSNFEYHLIVVDKFGGLVNWGESFNESAIKSMLFKAKEIYSNKV